MSKVITFF